MRPHPNTENGMLLTDLNLYSLRLILYKFGSSWVFILILEREFQRSINLNFSILKELILSVYEILVQVFQRKHLFTELHFL